MISSGLGSPYVFKYNPPKDMKNIMYTFNHIIKMTQMTVICMVIVKLSLFQRMTNLVLAFFSDKKGFSWHGIKTVIPILKTSSEKKNVPVKYSNSTRSNFSLYYIFLLTNTHHLSSSELQISIDHKRKTKLEFSLFVFLISAASIISCDAW